MKTNMITVTLSTLLLTLAPLGVQGVSVAEAKNLSTEVQSITDTDTDMEKDAEDYAIQYHVSKEKALEMLNLQENSVNDVVSKYRAIVGDRFAGAYLTHGDELTVNFRLTGKEPVNFETPRSDSGLNIKVWYDAPHNLNALTSYIESVNWEDVTSDVEGVYVQEDTGNVVIQVSSDEAKAESDIDKKLEKPLADGKEIPIVVEKTEKMVPVNRGGRILSSCTSGFTVRENRTGRLGVATAAHCPNSQWYRWFSEPKWFPLYFQNETHVPTADLQWHTTTSQPIVPIFHADRNDARIQKKKGVGLVGQFVCRFGRTSNNKRCGTVKSITYRPVNTDLCNKVSKCAPVYSLANVVTKRGDSGGPWFLGNTAHGFTSGGNDYMTVYTRVWYLNTLGLSLYLSK